MVKVCVLQADNRPSLDYLLKTQEINKFFCKCLGYDYLFLEIDNNKYGNIHPATKKIHVVNDFLQNTEYDILVFLDSDAWIKNGNWLSELLDNLINNENKHGCFSRDPYIKKNTFINSGSFIIKINDFTKQIYNTIINNLYSDSIHHNVFPYDQYYVSNCIFENKEKFNIFVPELLNTPIGKIFIHSWYKNWKMEHELWDLKQLILTKKEDLLLEKTLFNIEEYYDNEDFPNPNEEGIFNQYFDKLF